MADDEILVDQIAAAVGLIVQPAIAAAGSPQEGWRLFERAVERVRDRAHADGLVPTRETKVRIDDIVRDDVTGIISLRHGLGTDRVLVRLFTATGRSRPFRRGMPIDANEIEVIPDSGDVAYAEVEVME